LALWFAGGEDEDGAASEVCDRVVFGELVWCEPPLDAASSCVASFSCVGEDEDDDESWLLEPDDE
jgi:hypothetical protein